MRTLLSALASAVLLAGLCTRAFAGGFEVYDLAPTATGMAGAVSAKADDASAVFYNPAGLALHPGGGVLLGVTLPFVKFTATSPDGTVTTTQTRQSVIPTVYLASHLGDKMAAGIGLFSNFGSGALWSEKGQKGGMEVPFPGRFVATDTRIQTVTVNPTLAFKPIDVVLGSVELKRAVQFADIEGKAQLGGATQGLGLNFGVLITLIPNYLNAAFTYRSSVNLDFDLKVHFDAPPEVKDNVYDQAGKVSFELPHNFTLGLSTKPMRNLTLGTDVHYTMWSSFKELVVDFPDGKTPGLRSTQNWSDSWTLRVGGEYLLMGMLAIRLGAGYDVSPIPTDTLSPTAPGRDRFFVAAGLGATYKGFGLNAGVITTFGKDRTSTMEDFPATYGESITAFNVALSYHWGKPTACPQCGGKSGTCCAKPEPASPPAASPAL